MNEINNPEMLSTEFFKELNGRDLQSLVRSVIRSSKSVLDIGCGIGDYLKYTSSDIKVIAVEPHQPYIDVAKERTPWVTFHNTDGISFLNSTNEKFDCIIMIDVIEHLDQEDSIKLVKLAREHSNKIVFAQIPIGLHEQDGDDWNLGGEYWQTHRSTWTEDNVDKLGFSYVEIWKNWYEWDDSVQKSRDTSIGLWIKNYDETGLTIFLEDYRRIFGQDNFEEWIKAYQVDNYKSSMGDHTANFYNRDLVSLGLYDCIDKAKKIIEYGTSDAAFIKKFITAYPDKQFYIAEYFPGLIHKLQKELSDYKNTEVILNHPEISSLSKIDLSFSFLLSQSMPKTLWKLHLRNVKSMLTENGCYIFQFAYHPDGYANDNIQNGIYGNNKYKPDEIYKLLEETGYNGCYISSPIELKQLNSDITWYFCRAY